MDPHRHKTHTHTTSFKVHEFTKFKMLSIIHLIEYSIFSQDSYCGSKMCWTHNCPNNLLTLSHTAEGMTRVIGAGVFSLNAGLWACIRLGLVKDSGWGIKYVWICSGCRARLLSARWEREVLCVRTGSKIQMIYTFRDDRCWPYKNLEIIEFKRFNATHKNVNFWICYYKLKFY